MAPFWNGKLNGMDIFISTNHGRVPLKFQTKLVMLFPEI